MTKFPMAHDLIGDGSPVLVLNGFGCARWFFREQAERLQDVKPFVLADNRGMGDSPRATAPYSVQDLAQDALDLMDALGHAQFHLVGYSMGGFIAQVMALQAPERIRSLVMLCATGPGPEFLPTPDVTAEMLRESYDMDPQLMVGANVRMTTAPGFPTREPERFDWIVAQRVKHLADLDQLLLQYEAVQAHLKTTLPLERITCPALVMTGDGDRFVPPDNTRRLGAKLPNAEIAFVEESDHLFFLEKPEVVSSRLRAFWEAL